MEWQWLQSHSNPSRVKRSCILFCDLLWGAVGLWRIAFENLEVEWASSLGKNGKETEGLGVLWISKAYTCGGRSSLCCIWKLASLRANTSFFERFVSIFTSHVLFNIGQTFTYFFLLPLTNSWRWQGKTKARTLCCWCNGIPSSKLYNLEQHCHACQHRLW